ncbi:MAG: phosphorylase family protein [Candidatus Acidiferrales bacterium]
MRILVTFAIKAEFSPWSSRHPFVPYEFENWERRREFDLFKANIGLNEVTVLLTGMGAENAAHAMSSIPIELHDLCISAGLAGSLDATLTPSDIVVARVSETLDERCRAASDPSLVDLAVALGAKPVQVSLTSEKIVATAEEKEELGRMGSIVEMESTHILAAATQMLVPCVAVRAISDAADEDLPVDFARILDSHGHLKMGGLLKEVGLSPYRIPLLLRFGHQSRAAAKSLADFLDRYIPAISQNWSRVAHPKIEEVSAT